MTRTSLKMKLLTAFSFVSVFIVVVAGVGFYSMNKVQKEYGYVSDVLLDNMQKVNQMNENTLQSVRLNFRGYIKMIQNDGAEVDKIYRQFLDNMANSDEINKEYRSTPFAPGEAELYEKFWQAQLGWRSEAETYYALLRKALAKQIMPEEALTHLEVTMTKNRNAMTSAMEELLKFQDNESKIRGEAAVSAYSFAKMLNSSISLLGIVVAIVTGFYFANMISKTILKISQEILQSSEQTSSASTQLTASSSQLSQGATESAASLEETVSSLEELSSMVKLNSDHAKEANTLSQKSLSSAEQGEREIGKLISAMSDMAKSSKKIEEIINVIDDIAFQTNLLALNAAVEAARAGEQGKGFAVVADAVRNLAQRSAAAAKDINGLIKENVEKTVEGSEIADTSGSSLKEIVTSARKVADLNNEIAAASQEQANGIEQISKAMNHLDQAIQTNASSSEEVASSAEEMSAQSETLVKLVLELKGFVEGGKGEHAHHAPTSRPSQTALKLLKPGTKTTKKVSEVIPFDKDDNIGQAGGF